MPSVPDASDARDHRAALVPRVAVVQHVAPHARVGDDERGRAEELAIELRPAQPRLLRPASAAVGPFTWEKRVNITLENSSIEFYQEVVFGSIR